VAVAGGQPGAFLAQQRVGATTAEPGLVGHVLPGHRPVLGLASEQDADQRTRRLAVLPAVGRAAAGGFDNRGLLVLQTGRAAGVLTAVLVVLAVVLVAVVGQTQQWGSPVPLSPSRARGTGGAVGSSN